MESRQASALLVTGLALTAGLAWLLLSLNNVSGHLQHTGLLYDHHEPTLKNNCELVQAQDVTILAPLPIIALASL